MFVSYAQNGEDVVLWRIFHDVECGSYVDVGAADPTEFSVTRAFYDRGWNGINVEPVPQFAQRLREERPRDHTFEVGASDTDGEATLYLVEHSGLSTIDANYVAPLELKHVVTPTAIRTRTLNDMLDEAGFGGRVIHFLKIDVEGAEGRVLAGLDLDKWRPWVLVVESTEPNSTVQNYAGWEPLVLAAGYTFCLFDGLNRFYLAADHLDLAPKLSYPVGVFDFPFRSASVDPKLAEHVTGLEQVRVRLEDHQKAMQEALDAHEAIAAVRSAQLERDSTRLAELMSELHELRSLVEQTTRESVRWRREMLRLRGQAMAAHEEAAHAARNAAVSSAHAAEMEARLTASEALVASVIKTVSWRVTKPIRVLRRAVRPPARRLPSGRMTMPDVVDAPSSQVARTDAEFDWRPLDQNLVGRFLERVRIVTALLQPIDSAPADGFSVVIENFVVAADAATEAPSTVAWLAAVSILGSFPDEAMLDQATRAFRRGGGQALADLMLGNLEKASGDAAIVDSPLEVMLGGVLIDVSHTAAHDLHTGIQRVVKESASRWFGRPNVHPVQWNFSTNSMKILAESERERFIAWREHLHDDGSAVVIRPLTEATGRTVIPWKSKLLLPELMANPSTCTAYRALAKSGVVDRTALIGYDTVPIAATETVTDGMTANFAHYLSLVKHSTHLAAISHSAAHEFEAFDEILHSQGLSGPQVFAIPLPTEAPQISPTDLERAFDKFDLGSLPLVLVVGSHEPRKNHVIILEAAERMWQAGHRFDLLFAGGSGWGGSDFGTYVEALQDQGHPVRVYERVTEWSLWALYKLARFSVFPSLLEGYGLPIAESLAVGTPVVTSAHGSMAEIADGGGALTVDARSVDDLQHAMTELLIDDDAYQELRAAAADREWTTWEQYSDQLWGALMESRLPDAEEDAHKP